MIFLVQILRKPQNVSAWHPEKSGHDTLSMYKRACPRLGLSYLTPNGSTRLFQIIIWTIFQNVTSFWCTVLIWPDCPLSAIIVQSAVLLQSARSTFSVRYAFSRKCTFCVKKTFIARCFFSSSCTLIVNFTFSAKWAISECRVSF